jgi:hypothetical protein
MPTETFTGVEGGGDHSGGFKCVSFLIFFGAANRAFQKSAVYCVKLAALVKNHDTALIRRIEQDDGTALKCYPIATTQSSRRIAERVEDRSAGSKRFLAWSLGKSGW